MQGLIGTLFLSLFYIWSIAVEAPRQETTIAVAVWFLFETLAFPSMMFLFRFFFRMAVSNFNVQRLGRIKTKVAYYVRMLHEFSVLAWIFFFCL